jgi:hypothetical protein
LATGNKNQDGSTTWRIWTPTDRDTIRWISGSNVTDGTTNGPYNFGPETKFKFEENSTTPLAKTFNGFTQNNGPGPKGSTTSTSGGGSSGTVPGTLWGTNYEANWTINATGSLGGVAGAAWTSRAHAIDPIEITSTQLQENGVSGSSYKLFFAASLGSGSFTPGGSIGLDASYQTASGSTDLLNISIDGSGAVVTNSNPSNLSFYLLSSLAQGPTENPVAAMTLSGIQSMLNQNLSNNSLTAPLYVGIVWDNVPIPTTTMSDGALAEIQIGSSVVASAVPEPSAWLLLGTGLLGAICWQRRGRGSPRRRSAERGLSGGTGV